MNTHTKMKIITVAAIMVSIGGSIFASTQAHAQRINSQAYSCGQLISLVRSSGAVLLSTGRYTYDKYVANHAYCAINQELKRAYVPSADQRRCKVGYICKEKIFD